MEGVEGGLDSLVAAEVEDLAMCFVVFLAGAVVGVPDWHHDGEGEPALCWVVQEGRKLFGHPQLLGFSAALEVEVALDWQDSSQTLRDCALADWVQTIEHISRHLQ